MEVPFEITRIRNAKHETWLQPVKLRLALEGKLRYMTAIGYVNRPDLLQKAVQSIQTYWPHTVLIDNSDTRNLRQQQWIPKEIETFEPPVPLSFPQTMNYLFKRAVKQKCDVLITMHNDAEAYPGTPEALLLVIEALNREGRKWGVVYTNLDYLVAFNIKAFKDSIKWDASFPQYFSDTDWYWRMGVAGYEYVWSKLPVAHVGSSSVLSDSYRGQIHHATFQPLYEQLYIQKWGGTWLGHEKYEVPFNGAISSTFIER